VNGIGPQMPVTWTDDSDNHWIGRVCRVNNANGFCCVQFGGELGCLKIHKSRLTPASQPAPHCTPACMQGC
jgi:hypothetical protein